MSPSSCGLVFLSQAEDRFCLREGCPGAVRQCLGMGDPALAGREQGQGAGSTLGENGQGKREEKKKKPTKVSLQVLNFTLSRSNHFAKYKHIFSHIQTAKYSIIFTFRYSA